MQIEQTYIVLQAQVYGNVFANSYIVQGIYEFLSDDVTTQLMKMCSGMEI